MRDLECRTRRGNARPLRSSTMIVVSASSLGTRETTRQFRASGQKRKSRVATTCSSLQGMFSRRAVRPAISAASCGVIEAHAPSSRHVPSRHPHRRQRGAASAVRMVVEQPGHCQRRDGVSSGSQVVRVGVEPDHPRRLARCMIPVPCLWQRLRGARSTGTRGRGRLTAHHPLPIL